MGRPRDFPEEDYQACAVLCPARMPRICQTNLYRELLNPGSTPVRAAVWMSRWRYWAGVKEGPQAAAPGQLELSFDGA